MDARGKLLRLAGAYKTKKNEKEFYEKALDLFLDCLKYAFASKDIWYEKQSRVEKQIRDFCQVFTAYLIVLRTGQDFAKLPEVERVVALKENEAKSSYIKNQLEPRCKRGDPGALAVLALFLQTADQEIQDSLKSIFLEVIKGGKNRLLVAEIIRPYIPGNEKHISRASLVALQIFAKADAAAATSMLMDYLRKPNKDVRQTALCIFTEAKVLEKIGPEFIRHLISAKSKILWSDVDHRYVVYRVVANLLNRGILLPEQAVILSKKAFTFENSNRGLGNLLPLVKKIEVQSGRQLLFDGFLRLEAGQKQSFSYREETVEKFIKKLAPAGQLDFLRKSMLRSRNKDFLWFAGQRLIALDVQVASETFIAIVKKKSSTLENIGAITQLAMGVSNKEPSSKWKVKALNGKDCGRFYPVALSLLSFAESSDCPLVVKLEIAYQVGMFGGNQDAYRRSVGIIGNILADSELAEATAFKALQALLNMGDDHDSREIKSGELTALRLAIKQVLANTHKKHGRMLMACFIKLITTDTRGYSVTPLFPPVVDFLAGLSAKESVPIFKVLLNAGLPDADLGMFARQSYISTLKKFAIAGSIEATKIIAEYDGRNTWNELVPKTLIGIYQETKINAVKQVVVASVAKRFVDSIGHKELCYFYEIKAIEILCKNMVIQRAYVDGLKKIGQIDIDQYSLGMCDLAKKFYHILSPGMVKIGKKILNQVIDNLIKSKEAYQKRCQKNHWFVSDNNLKLIDQMTAELSMLLAGV